MSGTRCNAYEQEPDFLEYTHIVPGDKRNLTSVHSDDRSALCRWGGTWRRRYSRTMGEWRDRRGEAAFQGFRVFMSLRVISGGVACNVTLSLILITGVALPQLSGLDLIYSSSPGVILSLGFRA